MRSSIHLLASLLLCTMASGAARGEVLSARVARVSSGAGTLGAVQLELDWPRGAVQGQLRIRAGTLDFPAIEYAARGVDWQCPLRRTGPGGWACDGTVRTTGGKAQRLALVFDDAGILATLDAGAAGLAYRMRHDAPGQSDVMLRTVPVGWLKAFLAGLWEQGRWTAGTLDGGVHIASPAKGPFLITTKLKLAGVGLETPDGLLATDRLASTLRLAYRQAGTTRHVDAQLGITGGELLFNRLYAKFPKSPVQVHVVADREGTSPWTLGTLEARDPGVIEATGNATLTADASVRDLDMRVRSDNLSVAGTRYLSGFLAPEGFGDLILSGKLDASIKMREGALHALSVRAARINAVDSKARFTFAGIDGTLDWRADATQVDSSIAWDSGALFGIGLGPARFPFSSASGALVLRDKVVVSALGGSLVLNRLHWQAPSGEAGPDTRFGLALQSMDLASLSQRLGWPAFTGTVSGSIPSARLHGDVLDTEGGVDMQLFGGTIHMGDLGMERPFGTAPTLSANVEIQDLDLEPMTRVIGFGSISGRLDGRIDALRLVNWTPVAFDAQLHTDDAWDGKRRISQAAVSDISSVGGGGGLSGGLQAQALKLFKDFGYSRIGIGCVLHDNVCTMDGIGSAGDGYIIVAGAGLPRIQVVGFRRRVDWPTLVSRLRAASNGQAPVIQ
ncbi:hypothetical protein BH11PSE14_BH11PSE14_05690 [soil metagenome]